MYELIIASKRYSSWSMRPWVLMRHAGLPFTERQVDIYGREGRAELTRISPAGKVPVLRDGDLTIHDSLAIVEYLAERHPDAGIWPRDSAERARARAVAAEMHSGFPDLRNEAPMNCATRDKLLAWSGEARRDIDRVLEIWNGCRERHAGDGPYLFGEFCAADAMFAPVAVRFRAYSVRPTGPALDYWLTLLANPSVAQWIDAGESDTRIVEHYEVGSSE